MDKYPMTVKGYASLKAEFEHLKKVERPEIIEAIAVARDHGDLSENAEYHSAREKQGFIEGRIAELEEKIGKAEVIDPAELSGTKVMFGATVVVFDEDTEEELKYQIVGQDESDIKSGKLSIGAPLSRALISKNVGDAFEVKTPKGAKSYEIVSVEFI